MVFINGSLNGSFYNLISYILNGNSDIHIIGKYLVVQTDYNFNQVNDHRFKIEIAVADEGFSWIYENYNIFCNYKLDLVLEAYEREDVAGFQGIRVAKRTGDVQQKWKILQYKNNKFSFKQARAKIRSINSNIVGLTNM